MTKESLTDRYGDQILKSPNSNLREAFTDAKFYLGQKSLEDSINTFKLGEHARKVYEGKDFLDLGLDPDRAEEDLLLYVHRFIDWAYLAEVYLGTLEN